MQRNQQQRQRQSDRDSEIDRHRQTNRQTDRILKKRRKRALNKRESQTTNEPSSAWETPNKEKEGKEEAEGENNRTPGRGEGSACLAKEDGKTI